ncbi:alpha/beta hydrolase [Halobacillus sp. A1]|uniref:alpha/beta hydrolase n=1 Tax=Halobacillus sp. A1 TaxID=2880262 RepID=UPI0020A6A577|nr:alpha/beta hydrolase [Halobacillus sp. A1]MCP3030771.1 alpha/beta hydrolase [Halobacillus sp. A1]
MKTEWKKYVTRDFTHLHYAHFSKPSNAEHRAFIMIHGVTAEVDHHKELAASYHAGGDVFLPILRGYDSENERGDLSYLGQYDEDLMDFIHYVRNKGFSEIILAGHSMGCANILRLINNNKTLADFYVFIAPYFHPRLPVYQNDANDQFKPETDVDFEVYSKKATALAVLHRLGLNFWDKSTVALIPDEFGAEGGTLELTFRLIMSRFLEKVPENLLKEKDNFITFVGEKDEVILPEKLKKWHQEQFQKEVILIPGEDHNHILHHSTVHDKIASTMNKQV